MPFAGYKDFDACVAANSDKSDPKGYCATIMRATEKGKELVEEEKCDDMAMPMPMYDPPPPLGGSQTFAEMHSWSKAQAISGLVAEVSMQFQTLLGNIMSDETKTISEKVAAVAALTKEAEAEVSSPDMTELAEEADEAEEGKSLFEKAKSILGIGEKRNYNAEQRREMAKNGQARPDGSFPIKDVTDLKNALHDIGRGGNNPGDKANIKKRAAALGASKLVAGIKEDTGFKIYKDQIGNHRWLSFSSNAFQDRQKELFTTKALEEAVAFADKSGERGPLLVYHVPSAEIGQCDYQAVVGRFLVESGTFDDTPLGRKALEYYANSDEDHQISIGYKYVKGDELDGEYDWFRFKERSVCPYNAAANAWTDFKVIGEKDMNDKKVVELEKIFGKDTAANLIAQAEQATKELEEGGIKFKAIDEEEPEKKDEEVVDEAKHFHDDVSHSHPVAPSTVHYHVMETAGKDYYSAPSTGSEKAMPPALAAAIAKKKGGAAEDKVDKGSDEASEDDSKAKGKKDDEGTQVVEGGGDSGAPTQLGQIAVLLSGLITKVDELSTAIPALQAEVKEIKKGEDERTVDLFRGNVFSFPGGIRPSEDRNNRIDENGLIGGKSVADMVKAAGQKEDDSDSNPAKVYVDDLLGGRTRIGVMD